MIPPGSAGKIKASIHTANYHGAITKGITVTCDDPSQGTVMLSVKASIVGSVSVFPYPSLSLSPRVAGFQKPARLLIRKEDSETGQLAVTDTTSSVPWLKLEARKVTEAEPASEGLPAALPGDYVLSVQASGAPVGSSAQNIAFKTGLTREPQVSIPILVMVRPPVVVQPQELILQPVKESPSSASAEILATVREDLDPKAVQATAGDKAFVLTIENPGERALRIKVDWARKGKQGATETKVHLEVAGESVDVPVRVNLALVGAPAASH